MPNILAEDVLAEDEGEEHGDHHGGAGCDDPGGLGEAVGDGERVVAGPVVLLLDPGQEEDFVVHREPEQDREDADGQQDRDRGGLRECRPDPRAVPADREREDAERAALASRFMITALRGTTTERNTIISSTNETSSTPPKKRGSRSATPRVMSRFEATVPPTATVRPVSDVASGMAVRAGCRPGPRWSRPGERWWARASGRRCRPLR
jgi:hypothetical protein